MALIDGRTSILEIIHGNENGSGRQASLTAHIIAPPRAGAGGFEPRMFSHDRDRAMVAGSQFIPAHRTKQPAHAGAWKKESVVFNDGEFVMLKALRMVPNTAAEWNRPRSITTEIVFIRPHHNAANLQLSIPLTNDPGMSRTRAWAAGRFDVVDYATVQERCQGFALSKLLEQFVVARDGPFKLWSISEIDPARGESMPKVVELRDVLGTGTAVAVPVHRPKRKILSI